VSLLLVGIGNTLRRDDGAGAAVAERFAGRTACRVLVVHQLLPEHVEELARCGRVVFADAAVDSDRVRFERLTPSARSPGLGHTGDPAWLLALCDSLHGRSPEAWLLTVPGVDFGFGDGLSAAATEGVEEAVRVLTGWLGG
jgi:hydrogenase maturation protease